jgi:hypothetical protein
MMKIYKYPLSRKHGDASIFHIPGRLTRVLAVAEQNGGAYAWVEFTLGESDEESVLTIQCVWTGEEYAVPAESKYLGMVELRGLVCHYFQRYS